MTNWKEMAMGQLKKCWIVLLLGAVLMATLMGVAGARPMGAISRRITVPAGHFIAHDNNDLYYNGGYQVYSKNDGITEIFTAPVVFPTGQSVVVESITLYLYDENASDEACVTLYRTDPTAGDQVSMAAVCSTGSSSTNPRSFTDISISNNPLKHGKGVYLWLTIEDNTNLDVYGVRIQYHHGTT
jgi:hypothetical protein